MKNFYFILLSNERSFPYLFPLFFSIFTFELLLHFLVTLYAFLQNLTLVVLREPISTRLLGSLPSDQFPPLLAPTGVKKTHSPLLLVSYIETGSSLILHLHHYLPLNFWLSTPLRPTMCNASTELNEVIYLLGFLWDWIGFQICWNKIK